MNLSSNSGDLFLVMFSDSDIAKWSQCECSKAGYVAHFSLAPYILERMLSKLSDCPYIIIRKSLNFFIFWWIFKQLSSGRSNGYHYLNLELGTYCVATLYLQLKFMGRSTAEYFYIHLLLVLVFLPVTDFAGCFSWTKCESLS